MNTNWMNVYPIWALLKFVKLNMFGVLCWNFCGFMCSMIRVRLMLLACTNDMLASLVRCVIVQGLSVFNTKCWARSSCVNDLRCSCIMHKSFTNLRIQYYLISTEQFPTPVRNVGLGASSMMVSEHSTCCLDRWKKNPINCDNISLKCRKQLC